MKRIAIIPARGGSKRIPRKNIKVFFGEPIISYSIKAAINSGLYDEVMVSTDDETIANVATKYGAKIPFIRSAQTSDDFATTADVINEVINWYEKNSEERFEQGTCIYACAPFVNADLLKESFDILNTTKSDCVFPVIRYSHPIQRAFILNEEKKISIINDVNSDLRSQDLKPAFHDAGMFYSFDIKSFKQKKSLRTEDTFGIEISELNAHDIDSEDDWKLAELKFQLSLK
ncbi:MAG TPA: pseudaminic acid cytidylyltransferase [Pelobium sp.]|nr:pseudaminic acid cytidylyltransferase [Pelobium sp.]